MALVNNSISAPTTLGQFLLESKERGSGIIGGSSVWGYGKHIAKEKIKLFNLFSVILARYVALEIQDQTGLNIIFNPYDSTADVN